MNQWGIILLSLVLAGCGTSGQIRTAYPNVSTDRFTYEVANTDGMSDEALSILKARLDSQLAAQDRRANGAELDAKKIHIEISNYSMRHGAARALMGIMAGKDSIKSGVKIIDAGGTVLGQMDVDSGNATAWGTSRGLIEGHADEIVEFATGIKVR